MATAWMKSRAWLAGLLVLGVTGFASAQVFQLSTDPDDPKKSPTSESVSVRPNTPEGRYLFLKNPIADKRTYIVEMRDAGNRALLATGKVKMQKKDDVLRVKLEKTPPPPPPKTAAPVTPTAPPVTPPPPPAPEPPPGFELKAKDGSFRFVLLLLNEQGDPVLVDDKPIEASFFSVVYREPKDYFGNPTTNVSKIEDVARVDVSITSNERFLGPPAVVELTFPPQPSVLFGALRSGTYQRTVTDKNQTVNLSADKLPLVEGQEKSVRFYVNVDGYARAYIYDVDFSIPTKNRLQQFDPTAAVTLLPVNADRAVKIIAAKPGAKTPVRIQVDNPPDKSRLALRFDRDQNRMFSEADELIVIGNPREEHAFIDPQGENDRILITYQVTDHTYFLDTRSMRGRFELQAVLLDATDNTKILTAKVDDKDVPIVSSSELILDDTAPEGLRFGKLPAKHVKGTPLPLTAFADDPETSITQAIFFLGAPVEGKLPDTKVPGELMDRKQGLWVGALPVPDKKGVIEVGVVFMNETGIAATKTQKIELIDPPLVGSISGFVELGIRGQPGVVVILRDAEGKEKGTAVTEDEKDNKPDTPKDQRKVNGRYKFENVPPGTYRVVANKPDSGVGTKGSAPAQVFVGAETKVNVQLARKP